MTGLRAFSGRTKQRAFLRPTEYVRGLGVGMPVVKGIMLFEAFDQVAGWSEVYNIQADTLPDAVTRLTALAQVRCVILQSLFTITHLRISNPVTPATPGFIRGQRVATLKEVNLPGSYGGVSSSPDVVWTCGMCRFTDATQTIFRNILFRGVADELWAGGNDKLAQAVFKNWLGQFIPALVNVGAVILHRVRPGLNIIPALITQGQFMKMTRRATGRPFVLLRGRK